MTNKNENVYGNVKVIQRTDYSWGVTDLNNNVIVPFGKYDWIDGFAHGFARVKIGKSQNKANGNKWGIINEKGEEVLPVEYENIWNFLGKQRSSTKIVKDGITKVFLFNNARVQDEKDKSNSNVPSRDNDDTEHYEDFRGTYAQDIAGFSDEDIYDAFDGDPDAYWNID